MKNQYTGFEGYSVDELVREAYRSFEPLITPAVFLEVTQRYETAADELEAYEAVTLDHADIELLQDNLVNDSAEDTVEYLKVLAEFEVDDLNHLRAALQAAKIINEAA